MSGDLISILERDPELAEQLAATPGDALGQLAARQFLKARRVEVERQRRRDCEAEQWKAHEDAQHRRAIEAASAPIAQQAPGAITVEDLETVVIGIGREVNKLVDRKIASLAIAVDRVEIRHESIRAQVSDMARVCLEQLTAGDARIDAIEARPLLEDAGVWDQTKLYRPGAVVSDHGSAWSCLHANSNSRPPSDNWRLLVMRGRDGRDRR